jgi:membrane protein DedA with SNARE-associated domain
MRPLPLIAAVAILASLALRRRTLGRTAGAAGLVVAALLAGYGLGLYTLPSVDDALTRLAPALGNWTYPLVAVLAYLEAAAFVGLLVPGELTVVLGGAIARDGEISIVALFGLVWVAAAAGDTTGYLLGRRLGREFLMRNGPRFRITPAMIERVEGIFDRHGGKAIILGRFIGVARAITPFLAGTSHISVRRFLAFDVVGAGAWAASFLAAGYVVASSAEGAASLSRTIGFAIVAAAIIGGVAVGLRRLYLNAPAGERIGVALRWLKSALVPDERAQDPPGP